MRFLFSALSMFFVSSVPSADSPCHAGLGSVSGEFCSDAKHWVRSLCPEPCKFYSWMGWILLAFLLGKREGTAQTGCIENHEACVSKSHMGHVCSRKENWVRFKENTGWIQPNECFVKTLRGKEVCTHTSLITGLLGSLVHWADLCQLHCPTSTTEFFKVFIECKQSTKMHSYSTQLDWTEKRIFR